MQGGEFPPEASTRRLNMARRMLLFGLITKADFDIAQRMIEPTEEDLKDPFEVAQTALVKTIAAEEVQSDMTAPIRNIVSCSIPLCLVPEGMERNPAKVHLQYALVSSPAHLSPFTVVLLTASRLKHGHGAHF